MLAKTVTRSLLCLASVASALPQQARRAAADGGDGAVTENNQPEWYQRNLRTIQTVYDFTVYPANAAIVTQGAKAVPPGLFAPDAKGRVSPVGNFTGFEDSIEYFFALAPTPQANPAGIAFYKAEVVNFVSGCPDVATALVYFRTGKVNEASQHEDDGVQTTLSQVAFFHFNEVGEIDTYQAWIPNLQAWTKAATGIDYNSMQVQQAATQQLCPQIQKQCSGKNQQFSSVEDCSAQLGAKPFGNFDEAWGDNLACRTIHTLLTIVRPDVHCEHVGPTGGGKCVDIDYSDDYFDDAELFGEPLGSTFTCSGQLPPSSNAPAMQAQQALAQMAAANGAPSSIVDAVSAHPPSARSYAKRAEQPSSYDEKPEGPIEKSPSPPTEAHQQGPPPAPEKPAKKPTQKSYGEEPENDTPVSPEKPKHDEPAPPPKKDEKPTPYGAGKQPEKPADKSSPSPPEVHQKAPPPAPEKPTEKSPTPPPKGENKPTEKSPTPPPKGENKPTEKSPTPPPKGENKPTEKSPTPPPKGENNKPTQKSYGDEPKHETPVSPEMPKHDEPKHDQPSPYGKKQTPPTPPEQPKQQQPPKSPQMPPPQPPPASPQMPPPQAPPSYGSGNTPVSPQMPQPQQPPKSPQMPPPQQPPAPPQMPPPQQQKPSGYGASNIAAPQPDSLAHAQPQSQVNAPPMNMPPTMNSPQGAMPPGSGGSTQQQDQAFHQAGPGMAPSPQQYGDQAPPMPMTNSGMPPSPGQAPPMPMANSGMPPSLGPASPMPMPNGGMPSASGPSPQGYGGSNMPPMPVANVYGGQMQPPFDRRGEEESAPGSHQMNVPQQMQDHESEGEKATDDHSVSGKPGVTNPAAQSAANAMKSQPQPPPGFNPAAGASLNAMNKPLDGAMPQTGSIPSGPPPSGGSPGYDSKNLAHPQPDLPKGQAYGAPPPSGPMIQGPNSSPPPPSSMPPPKPQPNGLAPPPAPVNQPPPNNGVPPSPLPNTGAPQPGPINPAANTGPPAPPQPGQAFPPSFGMGGGSASGSSSSSGPGGFPPSSLGPSGAPGGGFGGPPNGDMPSLGGPPGPAPAGYSSGNIPVQQAQPFPQPAGPQGFPSGSPPVPQQGPPPMPYGQSGLPSYAGGAPGAYPPSPGGSPYGLPPPPPSYNQAPPPQAYWSPPSPPPAYYAQPPPSFPFGRGFPFDDAPCPTCGHEVNDSPFGPGFPFSSPFGPAFPFNKRDVEVKTGNTEETGNGPHENTSKQSDRVPGA